MWCGSTHTGWTKPDGDRGPRTVTWSKEFYEADALN
jgi:hypothetical protein